MVEGPCTFKKKTEKEATTDRILIVLVRIGARLASSNVTKVNCIHFRAYRSP